MATGKSWHDSSISYQILVLLLFKGATLQKFYQMHWLSFSLIHPCEHRARTAYCNVTAYYYSTMVAHGLSGTHAKWPKYRLGFRAPRIPLLLNTQHFHICHNHCAAPLLSFLLEENKAKNAGLDFLRHHQTNTSSPEKSLKEHLAHKNKFTINAASEKKKHFQKDTFNINLWKGARTDWHYPIITPL